MTRSSFSDSRMFFISTLPCMTEEWRKAIRRRNLLWKMLTREHKNENYEQSIISYFTRSSD